VTPISQDLIPLSGVPIPRESERSRHHSHDRVDKLGLDEEKRVLPEIEGFLVTNSVNIPLEAVLQRTSTNNSTLLEEDSKDDSSSIYIVNLNSPEHSRQLKGRNLQTHKGMLAFDSVRKTIVCSRSGSVC